MNVSGNSGLASPQEAVDGGTGRERALTRADVTDARLEVAVAILPSIIDYAEDHEDQLRVIVDIVRRWQGLEPMVQETYREPGLPFSPLTWFAWRFVDAIGSDSDSEPTAEGPPAEAIDEDTVVWRGWSRYLARLRDGEVGR